MDNLLIVKYARTDTADKEMAEVRRQARHRVNKWA